MAQGGEVSQSLPGLSNKRAEWEMKSEPVPLYSPLTAIIGWRNVHLKALIYAPGGAGSISFASLLTHWDRFEMPESLQY